MTRYCFECDAVVRVRVDDREETYPVLGEPITLVARVLVGTVCGHAIPDETYDDYTLREARDLYRQRHHLSPAEFARRQAARGGCMTTAAVILAPDAGDVVWDIGQLTEDARRYLRREVRAGSVIKEPALWPHPTSGTCWKTRYRFAPSSPGSPQQVCSRGLRDL